MASFFGLTQANLENALSRATLLALYDDGTGQVNTVALAEQIDRAENELISWIISEYGWPLPAAAASDPLLKYSAMDFAIAFSIERHTEAARQAGLGTKDSYFSRAKDRAGRILSGLQQTTQLGATNQAANNGGVVVDKSARLYVNNADGTDNAGDF